MAKKDWIKRMSTIEADIANMLNPKVAIDAVDPFAPPAIRAQVGQAAFGKPIPKIPAIPPIPEYVKHREGVSEVGQLSAEAMVREYETAAKEIEAMGQQIVERAHQCETMTKELYTVVDELKDTAAKYRDKAKHTFEEIEACSLLATEVRTTCASLRDKIADPAIPAKA